MRPSLQYLIVFIPTCIRLQFRQGLESHFPNPSNEISDAEINFNRMWMWTLQSILLSHLISMKQMPAFLGRTGFTGALRPRRYAWLHPLYMVTLDDSFVDSYVEEWNDPPYPRRNYLGNRLMQRHLEGG